jgi:hypothetical protein
VPVSEAEYLTWRAHAENFEHGLIEGKIDLADLARWG